MNQQDVTFVGGGILGTCLAIVFAGPLPAQSLGQRITSASSETVQFNFAARPGVCGSGGGGIYTHGNDDGWQPDCERGPVRVLVTHGGSSITRVRVHVGGHWNTTGSQDLGTVSVKDASDWLLTIAANDHAQGDRTANDAILGATLADTVVVWPRLLQLARSTTLATNARKTATFWLGQAAGEAATRGLVELVDNGGDREVREAAVFALSQRPKDEGVPALIHIARTYRDPEIRRKAVFWLGQADDPRALAYFEEVLTPK